MIPTGIIVVGSLKIQGPLCCVWHGMATAAQAEGTKGRRDRGRQTIRARGDDPAAYLPLSWLWVDIMVQYKEGRWRPP